MSVVLPNKQAISLDAIAVTSGELVSASLDGEVVILGFQSGSYYSLDQVGAFIWDLLQKPHKVSELRDAVLNEYEIDRERCEQDLFRLLEELADKGLVQIKAEIA